MSETRPILFDRERSAPELDTEDRTPQNHVFDQVHPEQAGYSSAPTEEILSPRTADANSSVLRLVENAPTPEISRTGNPKILVIGGAGARKHTLKGTARALNKEGLDSYISKPAYEPVPKAPGVEGQKRFQRARVEQGVKEVDELIPDDSDEKIALFGHSLGGPVAIEIALARPDKVSAVFLSNSEGVSIDPEVNIEDVDEGRRVNIKEVEPRKLPAWRLVGRFAVELVFRKNLTATKQGLKQTITGLYDGLRHPLAFVGGAIDGARTNSWPALQQLQNKGIDVHLLTSNLDQVYPAERTTESTRARTRYQLNEDGKKESMLPVSSISSYYATKSTKETRKTPKDWAGRFPKDHDELKEYNAATRRGTKTRRHNLASKFAGHDQPIIYPRYAAKVVRQMLQPNKIDSPSPERFTLSQQAAAVIKGGVLDIKEKLGETFIHGEKARRNRWIAAGVGVVAAGGAYLAARKYGVDLPFDSDGGNGNGGAEGADTTSTTVETPQVPGLEDVPQPRGDISANLNLPEGYISETANGYEVTAMYGADTDSYWRAAEHALTDRLGSEPNKIQIDALKDLLIKDIPATEHLLDVGDKVTISNEQVERALETARRQTA